MQQGVEIRVAEALRFLLPARDRTAGARRLGFDPDATIGHLVKAAGVPLTEVGELRLDGIAVDDGARARPNSVVEVRAAVRPERVPPGGFLADVGLGALTRRLRLLGLDAAWSPEFRAGSADDAELVAQARAEKLPEGTRRSVEEFSRCRRCGRLYWRGAHARRIDVLLRQAGTEPPRTSCPPRPPRPAG